MSRKITLFLSAFAWALLFSCDSDNDPTPDNQYLVSFEEILSMSENDVSVLASAIPDLASLNLTFEGVTVYKIVYRTDYVTGNSVLASGALILPDNASGIPLVSYQHGTITSQSDAPSAYLTGLETTILATLLSAGGYVLSVPDYLGYGTSSGLDHPYEHAETLASASFDMLMASKEFLEDMEITISEKLFLTGYSEGGSATMALHQYIEENSDLVVTMSAPASGAYNKTAFAMEILQKDEELNFLTTYLWVIHTYNWVYGLHQPWSYYVNETYATTLENLTNPMQISGVNVSKNPQELFTNAFRVGLENGTEPLLSAIADNNRFDWVPKYPITLYYGTADDFVFPINSETAFDALTNNGASVDRVIFEGADHGDAFLPYVIELVQLFESLK